MLNQWWLPKYHFFVWWVDDLCTWWCSEPVTSATWMTSSYHLVHFDSCTWKHGDPPLDFFLHNGGTPMIIIGYILICDDTKTTISQLLGHVGSPASLTPHLHWSHSYQSWTNSKSSLGSCTGIHISIPIPQASISSSIPMISLIQDNPSVVSPKHALAITPMSPLHPVPKATQVPDPSVTVTASPQWSAQFPNVDLLIPFCTVTPKLTVLHGKNGVPTKTLVPLASVMLSALPMGNNASAQTLCHSASHLATPIQQILGLLLQTGISMQGHMLPSHILFHHVSVSYNHVPEIITQTCTILVPIGPIHSWSTQNAPHHWPTHSFRCMCHGSHLPSSITWSLPSTYTWSWDPALDILPTLYESHAHEINKHAPDY